MNLYHNPFSEEQIKRLVDDLIVYIETQRQKYLENAKALSSDDMKHFSLYFSRPILEMARFLNVENERVENPSFLSRLNEIGIEFSDINVFFATTFHQVIVWRKEFSRQLQFHELVHVTQYEKLGLEGFADNYMRGLVKTGKYGQIPLEIEAYTLDKKYFENSAGSFSVDDEVKNSIAKGLY